MPSVSFMGVCKTTDKRETIPLSDIKSIRKRRIIRILMLKQPINAGLFVSLCKNKALTRVSLYFYVKTGLWRAFLCIFMSKQGFEACLFVFSYAKEGIILRLRILSGVNEALDARFLCQELLFIQETPFPASTRTKTNRKRASTAWNGIKWKKKHKFIDNFSPFYLVF